MEAFRSMARWGSAVAWPTLLFVILVGFFWRYVLTKQYEWTWPSDMIQQVMPWFEENAYQFQHGSFPLWDPHQTLGQPLLAQAQPGTAYPLNWLLFLIPSQQGHIRHWALQWYYVAIHFMAALFAFWLCRDLGCSRIGSLIGGLVFALCGYAGSIDWPQMLNGAVWAPLVLMFLLRVIRGERPLASTALAAMSLGFSWLSGHHQVPIFLALLAVGVWIYLVFQTRGLVAVRAALFALFLFVTGAVSALQTIPTAEYGRLATRWVNAAQPVTWSEPVPYYVHQNFSLGALPLLAIVFPGWTRHADPFLGMVALGLAILAVALAWNRPVVKLLSAIAAGGLVYSLGANSVFQGFLYATIPLVEKARVPSMAVIIFSLGAAPLVAVGADRLVAGSDSQWIRRIAIAFAGMAGLTLAIVQVELFAHQLKWGIDDRAVLTAFIALAFSALAAACGKGRLSARTGLVLVVLLLLFELGDNAGLRGSAHNDEGARSDYYKVAGNRDMAAFLARQQRPFRMETKVDDVSGAWGPYNHFDAIDAPAASVTSNVVRIAAWTWQTRLLFGVKYSIARESPIQDGRDAFTAASGLKVFENPGAFPRAWVVHEVIPIRSDAEGREIVEKRLPELREKAMVMDGPVPALVQCGGQDTVSFVKYEPSHVVLQSDLQCDGIVVLSDTFYPGWRATVDGGDAAIHEVNLMMRGVVVPRGRHRVEFRYRPRSVVLGALLTLSGVGAVLGLAWFDRRRGSV